MDQVNPPMTAHDDPRMKPPLDLTLRDGTAAAALSTTGEGDVLLVIGRGRLVPIPIAKDEMVIGRAEDCDVVVDHPNFSRRHAVLRRTPHWSIMDLGSTNGTRVQRTAHIGGAPVLLEAGESFHIGPFSFVVMAAGSSHVSSGRNAEERLSVDDPSLEAVSPLVHEVARSAVNVLILGETGAGKEVLASTVHALSGRRGPFARVNCAALSETLLESELFGHERGAFTGAMQRREGRFELAHKGTLLLDEVSEVSPRIQAKLLRVLEEEEFERVGGNRTLQVDVRVIATSNKLSLIHI